MKDDISRILLKGINGLFLYNFVGTSLGCLVGLLLLSLQGLIAEYIPQIGLIKWYGFIVFGILLFNIPRFVTKKFVDPKIESKLRYLREIIKEANFSKMEAKAIWRNFLKTFIESSVDIINVEHGDNSDNISVE